MSAGTVQLHQVSDGMYLPQNLLVNPGFEIWQRGASIAVGSGLNFKFTADEWMVAKAISTDAVTVSQSSAGVANITATLSGSNNTILAQGIENYAQLEGAYLTFSADVQCNVADCAFLRFVDSESNVFSSAYHTGDGTWQRLIVVASVGTLTTATNSDFPHAFKLRVQLNAQKTVTNLRIKNASLVLGNFPQGVPFIPLNPADDMQRCQRFYENNNSFISTITFYGDVISGQEYRGFTYFNTKKFATPTLTRSSEANVRFPTAANQTNVDVRAASETRVANTTGAAGYFRSDWQAEVT